MKKSGKSQEKNSAKKVVKKVGERVGKKVGKKTEEMRTQEIKKKSLEKSQHTGKTSEEKLKLKV